MGAIGRVIQVIGPVIDIQFEAFPNTPIAAPIRWL